MRRAAHPQLRRVYQLCAHRCQRCGAALDPGVASVTFSAAATVSHDMPLAAPTPSAAPLPPAPQPEDHDAHPQLGSPGQSRTLYPRVQLRARTQERPYKRHAFAAFQEQTRAENGQGSEVDQPRLTAEPAVSPDVACVATERHMNADVGTVHAHQQLSALPEGNEVQQFLDEVQRQVDVARHERNQSIPFPRKPEACSPAFRRVKRHAKMTVEVADPDYPTFARKDQVIQLPPPQEHPWVRKNTPIGPFIVHGDGQIDQTGGTGQVDFDDSSVNERLPPSYRGLQHRSTLQRHLPQDNGRVLQDAVIRHSFALTGRGVFATRRVSRGESIMIVQSTARNVGVKGELQRLEEMCVDILLSCRDGDERVREYLHDWILTGQPSSLLEHWPQASTVRVLAAIGGAEVMDELELHPIHIARLAAILDLNSFLVESGFAERKGMAYFPEAGFLNHSCVPNATYDIMPEHVFRESDYYLDEAAAVASDGDDNFAAASTENGAQKSTPRASTTEEEEVEAVVAESGDSGRDAASAAASATALTSRTSSARECNTAYLAVENRLARYPDLGEAGAPVYLFCCRAEKDIEPGEEILISYVPPQWSFDNRQYVLHDRYHFWCKCPKCAPVLDKQYARVPKLLVGFVVLSILLQLLVFYQRDLKNTVDEDFNRLAAMSEEDRLEELRARGISPEDMSIEAVKKRRQQRAGLFEMMEEERLRKVYEPDNRGYLNVLDRMNPLSESPR